MDKRKKASDEGPRTPSKTTPTGVSPVFSGTARFRRETTGRLLNLFSLWGYREIILPSFEYLDAISPGIDPSLLTKLYLMQDRGSGQVLVLRPDATAQIARLTTQSFRDQQLPLRFCYSTSVFRDENHHTSLQRELQQTGLELLGEPSVVSDGEILELCLSGAKVFPLRNPVLVLSHAGFQERILRSIAPDPVSLKEVRAAFHSRNPDKVVKFLGRDRNRIQDEITGLLGGVYTLHEARSVLASISFLKREERSDEVAHFLHLLEILDESSHGESVRVDFALSPPGPYYTGMFFQMFADESHTHLASGGRYDQLGKSFGHDLPAVGFAYHISHIEEAIRKQEGPQIEPFIVLACYQPGESVLLEKFAQSLRSEGRPVMIAPDPSTWSGLPLSHSEILAQHDDIAAVVRYDLIKKRWVLSARKKNIRTADSLSEIVSYILSSDLR